MAFLITLAVQAFALSELLLQAVEVVFVPEEEPELAFELLFAAVVDVALLSRLALLAASKAAKAVTDSAVQALKQKQTLIKSAVIFFFCMVVYSFPWF